MSIKNLFLLLSMVLLISVGVPSIEIAADDLFTGAPAPPDGGGEAGAGEGEETGGGEAGAGEGEGDGDGDGDENANANPQPAAGGVPPGIFIGSGGQNGQRGFNQGGNDPLANRIRLSIEMLRAQSEYKKAHAEYLKLLGEARKAIAEAVDVELDVWKKKVVVYFERHEENMRSKMRRKDLYDVAADQSLRLRDTAARRRYEYMKRHPRLGGRASHTNLNFLLDQFVGTPIGYGIPLEEAFASNPEHEQWMLSDSMHRKLKVRQNSGSGAIEFRLDQTTPVAFDWPDILRDSAFAKYRNEIDRLNSIVVTLDEYPTEQRARLHQQAAERMQRVFALTSREFFKQYPDGARKGLPTVELRAIIHGEDFLSQKTNELTAYQRNPERLISASQTFDPREDGRDAGTLISFMTRNGLRFTKPSPGDESAYHQLHSMMMELYALYGEPLMEVAKTEVKERPQPPKEEAEPPGAKELAELKEIVEDS